MQVRGGGGERRRRRHVRGLRPGPIPVQRISGPVLAAGAGDDLFADSEAAVMQIGQRLRDHHFRFRYRTP